MQNPFPYNRPKRDIYPKPDPCECKGETGPRLPDYGTVSVPIFGPIGIAISVDRHGTFYAGPGVGAGLRGGAGLGFGWTGHACVPTEDQLKEFLGGWGLNSAVVLGATLSSPFSQGSEKAERLGPNVQSPGASYDYNWVLGNPFH